MISNILSKEEKKRKTAIRGQFGSLQPYMQVHDKNMDSAKSDLNVNSLEIQLNNHSEDEISPRRESKIQRYQTIEDSRAVGLIKLESSLSPKA